MNTLQRRVLVVGSLLMAIVLVYAVTDWWARSPNEYDSGIGMSFPRRVVAPGQVVVIALVLAAATTGVYFACSSRKK